LNRYPPEYENDGQNSLGEEIRPLPAAEKGMAADEEPSAAITSDPLSQRKRCNYYIDNFGRLGYIENSPAIKSMRRRQMQIGSRFTIGVHILAAIDYFKELPRVSSEFLAESVGVNPVVVRTVISQLREAGLVRTRRGSSGAEPARPLDEITLYEVYKAVGSVDAREGLFHFHEQPNPECPVGRSIHKVLDRHLEEAQRAMEERLKAVTLAEIAEDTRRPAQGGAEQETGQKKALRGLREREGST